MTEKAVGKNIDEPVFGHTFLVTFSIQNSTKICTPLKTQEYCQSRTSKNAYLNSNKGIKENPTHWYWSLSRISVYFKFYLSHTIL